VSGRYVQALALGLDPAWRRLAKGERGRGGADLARSLQAGGSIRTFTYSMIGLQAGIDLLVWRLADSLEDLEQAAAHALSSGMGAWMTVRHSFLGLIQPSEYVRRPTPQEQSLFSGDRSRYLVVYPFTKSSEWYLQSREERQTVMQGHIKVGHRWPQVRQLLAYSFGIDDQDFLVAYETDDLPAFSELVRALRETESRRATVTDTPILTGIHRPAEEIVTMLGAG
jgi:chlorite dismutase